MLPILLRIFMVSLLFVAGTTAASSAEQLAKTLFGAQALPAATKPDVFGFYSKGCFAGGMGLAVDGPNWQVMRLSRNRRWGHPDMIHTLEQLSRDANRVGWNGLLVGDISQPRGGPMTTGHASHQLGLDADIWFTPMPGRTLSAEEREKLGAQSLIKEKSLLVDDRLWTRAHESVLKTAADYPQVERILVHPGIKKKLCDTVQGDRNWLRKIRPYWGHDSHFHVRIACPKGARDCRAQDKVPASEDCGKSLAWWFTDEPWRPATGPAKPAPRDVMTMAALPDACRAVLAAPSPSSALAVTSGNGGGAASQADTLPLLSLQPGRIPLPTPRPQRH